MERTTELELFGKVLQVKNYDCSKNGCPYQEKPRPLKLQLFICPTYFCPGNCPFCVAAGTNRKKGFLDPGKLERVLLELKTMDILRGVAITGGEPFMDTVLLNEIIEMIFDIFGVETQVSINTSGVGLDRLSDIQRLPFVDTIHVSRHHYDDARNQAYFGMRVPTGEEIASLVDIVKDPKLFVFNCLLLRDGIGTKEELERFLEFSAEVGVPKAGFVTPMPINDYVRVNAVSCFSLLKRGDPRFLFTKGYRDYHYCQCQDGVYVTASGKLVEFYGRETLYGSGDYIRGLVYGADNVLRDGFGADAEVVYS